MPYWEGKCMNVRLLTCTVAIFFTGCVNTIEVYGPDSWTKFPGDNGDFTPQIEPVSSVKNFDDVRWKDLRGVESQLDTQMIATLWFHQKTVWPNRYAPVAANVLLKGMNPGLGVRGLHAQGITGKNVNVAIIDQNLCQALDHPEYRGKIVKYHDVGTNQPYSSGSMHGPAVTSLLVGTNIGTAPDADLYFVAEPSWNQDAAFYANALDWIIDENISLPAGSKIRVVSVSAAPSGPGSPFNKNNASWDAAYTRARNAGILVIDCTSNHGLTGACYYDVDNPDDLSKVVPGYPAFNSYTVDTNRICVPNSFRTQAEESNQGDTGYQYTGQGGLSWTCPYMAGVLAMGWQVRPELSDSLMVGLLYKSAYIKDGKFKIINPVAFIDSVTAFGK
jgi:serine protease AprX